MVCLSFRMKCAPAVRRAGLGALAVMLAACGDGGGEEQTAAAAPTPTPPSTSANAAPVIGGTPSNTVMQGSPFTFTPQASDPDGDPLTFTIANKPSWATFASSTGRLSGTPGAGDVGTYANIVITVSDGTTQKALASFSIQVVATAAGSATLSWQSPTQHSDGTALTDLTAFKIYWGTSQGSYTNSVRIDNPGITSYVIDQLTPATWYFVATAVDSKGIESQFSNVASKTVL